MNSNKRNPLVSLFIFIIFIVFSYLIVKSFFKDDSGGGIVVSRSKAFVFVTNNELIKKNHLDDLYDETRTNKIVLDKNYAITTNDKVKGKLFLNPDKTELFFSNMDEEPKYYKMTLDKSDFLIPYSFNENSTIMNFAVLGSDLKYYKVSFSINENVEGMDIENKEWNELGTKLEGSYTNIYYKIIDEYCHLEMYLPVVYDESKYTEKVYNDLRDAVEKTITIEKLDSLDYGYFCFNTDDIKINDKVTLKLKDKQVFQYYSKNENDTKVSYTVISLITSNNVIMVYDIDDKDIYNKYLDKENTRRKEYTYKDIKTYLLYKDDNPNKYESIIFDIDDHYYMVSPLKNDGNVEDNSIELWINSVIDGILDIK